MDCIQQASLSFTISWSLLKRMFIESVMPSNHLILCHPLLLLPSILHQTKSVTFKHRGRARRFATKVPPLFIPRLAQRPAGTVRRPVRLRVTCHRAPGLSRRRRGQSGQPSQQGDWYRRVRGQKSGLAAFSTEPTGGGVSRSWVWNYEAKAPMARRSEPGRGTKRCPEHQAGAALPSACPSPAAPNLSHTLDRCSPGAKLPPYLSHTLDWRSPRAKLSPSSSKPGSHTRNDPQLCALQKAGVGLG